MPRLADFQKIENTPRPTAGRGLALDASGKVPASVVALRQATAACSGTTTVTATASPGTDITGATLTLAEMGVYLVWGIFDFNHTAAGASVAVGELSVNGTVQGAEAILSQSAVRGTASQMWLVTTTGTNQVAKLAAWKTVAAGTLVATATHTTVTAIRVG